MVVSAAEAGAVLFAALAGWWLPAMPAARLRSVCRDRHADASSADRSILARRPGRGRAVGRWLREREARRRRMAVQQLCQALSAELHSGAAPRSALVAAAEGVEEFELLSSVAASTYGDVPAALRRLAERPGGAGLGYLAACWDVCERSGAGLAVGVTRLAGALANDEQVRRETSAQLAGPKATAALLAVLPAFGLAMGAAMGAHPMRLLLHTPFGLLLLVTAAVLEMLGLLWTARITRGALPP